MINKEGTITMMFLDQYKKNIFSTGNLFNIKQIKPPFQYENKYLRLGLNNVFQMQLNLPIYIDDETQQSNTYILHNAYMVQATEKTCIWYNLPTTNNSIPEFIAAAEQEEKMRVN
jgi:hypothetical protein